MDAHSRLQVGYLTLGLTSDLHTPQPARPYKFDQFKLFQAILQSKVSIPHVTFIMDLTPEIRSIFEEAPLRFYLNGTKIELGNPNPQWMLLDFIRSQHGLKGTKLGCGEGGCGACTVVLQVLDTNPVTHGRVKHIAVNALSLIHI